MKNAPTFLTFSCLFLFIACQKEPILTPTTPPIIEDEIATDRAVPFEFTIQKEQCLISKVNVFVTIKNPQLYGYLWEVNGKKEGHLQDLEGCRCGTSATVTVMRFSDGIRIKRSIDLPTCSTTPPILPNTATEKYFLPNDAQVAVK